MSKEKCKGLVISKGYLEKHYPREYEKLNDLLGYDWYIYQYYLFSMLRLGNVVCKYETRFE